MGIRVEKYVAPPGTSDVPVPWNYEGDDNDAHVQGAGRPFVQPDHTIEEAAAKSSAHVQGATMASQPNYCRPTQAIADVLNEGAEAEKPAQQDEDISDAELADAAKAIGASLQYPLGRLKAREAALQRRRQGQWPEGRR